jgi:hypothetical protein
MVDNIITSYNTSLLVMRFLLGLVVDVLGVLLGLGAPKISRVTVHFGKRKKQTKVLTLAKIYFRALYNL